MKLGICMEGGEQQFLDVIEKQAKACVDAGRPFLYVEIGVAYGQTLRGVWETVKGYTGARVIGIELLTWEGWPTIDAAFSGEPFWMAPQGAEITRAGVILGSSRDVLTSHLWKDKIDVAFIDGCHSRLCATLDFIMVEEHISPTGIVIFHDAGEKEQGGGAMPHCHKPMGVRDAINDLRLFENKRPGWWFNGMLPTANECAVFQRLP